MWRKCERPRFTFPVAVFLKRLAAPLWVFSFGISPQNQLSVFRRQPSEIQKSKILDLGVSRKANLAPLRLRSGIGSHRRGCGRRRLFLFFLLHLLLLLRLLLGFLLSFLLPFDRRFLRR